MNDSHESLHILHRDLIRSEAEHAPARQTRFEIFLQIRVEPGSAIVPAIDPQAALDLDQATRFQMRKISPPTPLGIKPILSLQWRALGGFPEEQEAVFETRGGLLGTVSQAGHGLRGESNRPSN